MTIRCELKQQGAQPTMVIRTRAAVGDLPRVLGEAFGAIGQYLGETGQAPAGAPFVHYRNMDMQDLDLEIGFPVHRPLPVSGEITSGEIPAGPYATCLYTGPYSELVSAYDALMRWVEEQGYRVTGASYEVYLNDPNATPPEGLQTEILFPVVKG